MSVELIMMALVVAYVGIVVLGHVLLAAAIYKCLRQDHVGGRRRASEARDTAPAGNMMAPLPTH